MATHGFTLDEGEEIIKRIDKHWIDLAALASAAGVMVFMALAISYGFGRYRDLFPPLLTGWMVSVLVGVFIVVAGLILAIGLWVYRRNYVLITNHHLIQVEQRGLFHSQVDQVSLGRIQDVSGVRPGILATLLGYGTVTIQSAGEQRQFILTTVPDPQPLADYVLELHEKFVREHPGSGGE